MSCLSFTFIMLAQAIWLAFRITGFTMRTPAERSEVDALSIKN